MAKFKYKAARDAGYSDAEISEFLAKEHPSFNLQAAKEAGHTDASINKFLMDKQKTPGIVSKPSAFLKGAVEQGSGMNPFGNFGPVPTKLGMRQAEEFLPSEEEDDPYRRAGKVATAAAIGPEGLLAKAAQTAGGTLMGELAEKAGFGELGQTVSEGVGMGLPQAAKGVAQKGIQALRSPAEKMASGLTKTSAVDSKLGKFVKISAEREKQVTENLNKEATQLAEKSIDTHLPIAEKLRKGVDLETQQNTRFADLKKMAEKVNPEVNTEPLKELIYKEFNELKGIPNPSNETKAILREINSYVKKPQTGLKDLLKIYRENNKKKKHIYNTAMTGGRQEGYVKFLNQMNKSIEQSFEKELVGPEYAKPWMQEWTGEFKQLNKERKELHSARETLDQLKGILSSQPTSAQLTKLAIDPRTQKKLALKMGDPGAKEIIQIAKDLKTSREALKRIPKKDLSKYDAAFPVGVFVGLKFIAPVLGTAYGALKAADVARYGIGWLLSTPSRRTAYKQALDSLIANDLNGYKKATSVLLSENRQED